MHKEYKECILKHLVGGCSEKVKLKYLYKHNDKIVREIFSQAYICEKHFMERGEFLQSVIGERMTKREKAKLTKND